MCACLCSIFVHVCALSLHVCVRMFVLCVMRYACVIFTSICMDCIFSGDVLLIIQNLSSSLN